MTIFKNPENGAVTRNANVVIGHVGAYAVIKNEYDDIFCMEGDENQLPVGTYIENKYLISIKKMPKDIQQARRSEVEKGGE